MINKKLNSEEISSVLKLLSNPLRISILEQLQIKERCGCDLIEIFPHVSQPSISQHLTLLKMNKIIKDEKKGQHIYYKIVDLRVIELLNTLRKIH